MKGFPSIASMKFTPYVENLIASFRGFPTSYKHPSKIRKTLPINEILNSLTEKYNIGKHTTQDIIMANWQYVMGADHAQRACPSNINRQTLIVKVANPILRNELQFGTRGILERIQRLPQCQKIKRIIFLSG